MLSSDISNIITSGLANGCLYGLIGVGLVLIYRTTAVVSFAQGSFMMLGALLCGTLIRAGWGLPATVAVVVIGLALVGAAVYRIVFARLAGGDVFVESAATIGLATLLEAVSILIWGPATITLPQQLRGKPHTIFGNLSFSNVTLFTIAAAVVVFAVVIYLGQMTPTGLRMRAVANDRRLAAYLGVDVPRISSLAWALAAASGGVAGVAFLMSGSPDPGTVYSLGLTALPAIILGGFDSLLGALVGGIVIALIQAVVTTYAGGQWETVSAYIALLVVLLVRPQGLFGRTAVVRL